MLNQCRTLEIKQKRLKLYSVRALRRNPSFRHHSSRSNVLNLARLIQKKQNNKIPFKCSVSAAVAKKVV